MLSGLFERCMKRRGVKETDPFDWEKTPTDNSLGTTTTTTHAVITKPTHVDRSVVRPITKLTHVDKSDVRPITKFNHVDKSIFRPIIYELHSYMLGHYEIFI